MKTNKIIAFMVCTVLAFALCACSSRSTESTESSAAEEVYEQVVVSDYSEGTPQAELAKLYNTGFTLGGFSGDGEKGVQNYVNADHTEFRQAVFDMSSEQIDEYFAIDWTAEDYDQQVFDYICSCDNLEIVTPALPDSSYYEGYVGKTIQDMEDAGFELSYTNEDGNSMYLYFYAYPDENTYYTVEVVPDIAENDDTIYDDEGILPLVVKSIRFYEF